MYIVGTTYGKNGEDLRVVSSVGKNDLIKAKDDSGCVVIDVVKKKFFNPDNNAWENLPS